MNEESNGLSWTTEGSIEDVLKSFEDFPEWCKELFKLSGSCGLWQLRDIDPLPTWVKDRVIIIGDAAHAMLPLQGQGASQTFEDCEAVQAVFAGVKSKPSAQDVNERLKVKCATRFIGAAADCACHLQKVFDARYKRASLIQHYSRAQANTKQTASAPGSVLLNPMEFNAYNLQYFGYDDWVKRQAIAAN